jgi:AcrR family transcriptional regulator
MPRGVTKRRPATVAALLDAAMGLFAEQGFGGTSIPDICARAGLTKGAFYSNFASKEALFLALLDRMWRRRAEGIRAVLPASDTLAQALEGATELPVIAVDREWTLVSMEFTLHAIRRPDVATLLVEHEARARSELAALVAEALERAGRVPTIPVTELARMIVASSEGSDIQALTDRAGGAVVRGDLGRPAITGLLRHFSRPAEPIPQQRQEADP